MARDGGSAFPVDTFNNDTAAHQRSGGMSLRDWFAGQALAGELAAQSPQVGEWVDRMAPQLAERCYLLADAMLAAREKETKKP